MPFGSIQLRPGVNTVQTPTLNQAGISKSNLIRFRMGLVEKLGGWTRFITSPLNSITRVLHAWEDLESNSWLAAGNLDSFDAIVNGSPINITPQTLISNVSLNLSTTAGSNVVIVIDTNINTLTTVDAVFFNTPITIGGIVLSSEFQINSVISSTEYTILAPNVATLSENNVGSVPSLTTVAGSSSINVSFANHGLSVGSKFVFPIPVVIGGLTISGIYSVSAVSNVNAFTIIANAQATFSSTLSMNGGNAQYLYQLVGGQISSSFSGGIGAMGQYAIGQGFVVESSESSQDGIPITAPDWTADNWGEIIVGCPYGGLVWYWDPSSGYSSMLPVGTGPPFNNGVFIAMPAQILVAWGSCTTINTGNTDSQQDPLLVRWSDQLNFLQWNVNSNTQAGSFHIPSGSKIVGGIQGSGIALIFTDVDIWSMTYIGYPLIFGFNKVYSSAGLIGPHAVCEMRGAIYWMSSENFYVSINGSVNVIPCSVWDNVFQNLDTAHGAKAVAAPHPDFNEVWFFYPSINGSGENDSYVKINVAEGAIWDYGSMNRSAWQTRSILGPPIGADPTTLLLQQHETSYSADGGAMDSFIETGYFAYGDGENFGVVDHFEPDMKYTTYNSSTPSAQIGVTLTTVNYPNDTASMTESLTMTSTMEYLTSRVRGRQIKWNIGTNDTTSWWRLGNIRYRIGIDGRR